MELSEKIIMHRITDPGQLSAAEQARVAADPELMQLIEHNAEFAGIQARIPVEPQMQAMLHKVKLAESIMPQPQRYNLLENIFGQGWQYKAAGSLAVCAVLAAALFAIPSMLSGRNGQQADGGQRIAEADPQEAQAMLADSSFGTWLEYNVGEGLNDTERGLLHEKLQLAVSDNSSGMEQQPIVHLLADGSAYSVFVPTLGSTDPRIDEIDNSIRRVERFSLQRRSNRLYLEGTAPVSELRLIESGNSDIAFPAGMSDQQLVSVLEAVVPQLPQAGLPQDSTQLAAIVRSGFAAAGYDDSWLAISEVDIPQDALPHSHPGMSESDMQAIEQFERLELRLGNRLENSLAMYQLSDEQIENYRRDLEHELQLHLLLPSNWNTMKRSELDDYVYSRLLMQCRAMGIDTVDIDREQIAVFVNDEPADTEVLPTEPHRLTVEIR